MIDHGGVRGEGDVDVEKRKASHRRRGVTLLGDRGGHHLVTTADAQDRHPTGGTVAQRTIQTPVPQPG